MYSVGPDENKQDSFALLLNLGVGIYNELMWTQVQPFRKHLRFFKVTALQALNALVDTTEKCQKQELPLLVPSDISSIK